MKPIPGYNRRYFVTKDGRIFGSFKANFLCPSIQNGYAHVSLFADGSQKSYRVHRLVAEAYLPNPENKPHVNHKDRNRTNNDVSNLEWCTVAENNAHARKGTEDRIRRDFIAQLFTDGWSVTEVIERCRITVREALAIKHNI